jgi:hypothetical protein
LRLALDPSSIHPIDVALTTALLLLLLPSNPAAAAAFSILLLLLLRTRRLLMRCGWRWIPPASTPLMLRWSTLLLSYPMNPCCFRSTLERALLMPLLLLAGTS